MPDETPAVIQKDPWYRFNGAALKGFDLKINSNEEAYKVIMELAWTLLVLGLALFIISFILLPGAWLDGLIFMTAGALLGYKKRTWVGWLVVALASVSLLNTAFNQVTGALGGRNIFLAAMILFFAIKAQRAIRFLAASDAVVAPVTRLQKAGEQGFPYLFWGLLIVDAGVLGLILSSLFVGTA
jgi:hypothetical protein